MTIDGAVGIIDLETGSLQMNRLIQSTIVGILCLAAVLSAFTLIEDCEVHGSLRIDGSPAAVNMELVAVIGAEEVARTTVSQSGSYSVVIHAYDPQKPDVKGFRSEDDVITVYVDGRKAEPSFNARSGSMRIDLAVKTSLEVRQSTWGKIKALFK